jgi:hypothetical protein
LSVSTYPNTRPLTQSAYCAAKTFERRLLGLFYDRSGGSGTIKLGYEDLKRIGELHLDKCLALINAQGQKLSQN